MSSKRRVGARARAATAAWLQAEQRRRQAVSRAIALQRRETRSRLADQGLRVVSLRDALDEDDPVQVLTVHEEQDQRRRTG